MISTIRLLLLPVVAAAICLPFSAAAQDNDGDSKAAPRRLAQIHDVKIASQKTPDFTLKGATTDKRWKPKDWLEIEPEITFSAPRGSTAKTIPQVQFKYYIYLDAASRDGKRILTADVTHTSVPIGEKVHSVVYVSPSTILRISGKPEGAVNLVKGVGLEIVLNGELVGFYSSVGGRKEDNPSKPDAKWWTKLTGVPSEAELKNKMQTPFAPLWGDYHLDVMGSGR